MDFTTLSAQELDQHAWEAICRWPEHAGLDVVRDGLDYGHLTRSFLWDKVGRAVRGSIGVSECGSVGVSEHEPGAKAAVPLPGGGGRLRSRLLRAKLAARRRFRGTPVLYCPFPYSRNARIMETLLNSDRTYEIAVLAEYGERWPGAVPIADCGLRIADCGEGEPLRSGAMAFAESLREGIVTGLRHAGIEPLSEDVEILQEQIRCLSKNIPSAEAVLARLRPEAVLVPVDNCSPFIEMVCVARRMGIPTIMLQHGLDCERYYLDEAYASDIAVWGEERKKRYEHASQYRPERIETVGNPDYDRLTLPSRLQTQGYYWLWVTRPHVPVKCHAPSRRPDEGLDILDALLDALSASDTARLVIKAHPFDYRDLYEARIRERGLDDRVRVADDLLSDLLKDATMVITEDSTAGMDAMTFGKVLVHAHFAESPPTMPFVDYAAALPGFSAGQLVESLKEAQDLPGVKLADMQSGQSRFLGDFAGPLDGQSAERFTVFLESVLRGRGKN